MSVAASSEENALPLSLPLSTSIHLCFDPSFRTPVEEQIRRIARAGFRWLDFNFLDWFADPRSPFVGGGWEAWLEGAGAAAEDAGARFNQAHAPCPVYSLERDLEGYKALCRRAIRGCGMLGIPWMVFHAAYYPWNFGSSLDFFAFNQAFFGELLEDCHRYSVGIAIENIWPVLQDIPIWSTDALIQLADSFHDPLVGICWDTGHGNLTGNSHNYKAHNTPQFLPYGNQYESLTKIGGRLKALHIHDNNGMDDDHLPPFFGTIQWKEVLRGLRDIGYRHSFTFEAHYAVRRLPPALLDDGIAYLYKVGRALLDGALSKGTSAPANR